MSKVGEWIQHPERLNEDSVGVLRRLVDKYPYYQTARLLLLRNLFNTKNPMFQQELRRSAVLLNNRKVLFDMIEGTKYHIVPQQLSSNSLSLEDDKDRTLSLIDDFLENMPSEPEKRPTKGNIPADVTTDYMAYLMQEEAEANRIEEKSNTELIEQLNRGNNIRDKKVQQNELIEELYRRAIENIKISEWERMKINKNDFSDKDEIIDILLYSLGKMAQDPMFYKLNVQKLKGHNPIYEKEAE